MQKYNMLYPVNCADRQVSSMLGFAFPVSPPARQISVQDIEWSCLEFQQLPPAELYSILQLRTEVFVIEQSCVYQDMDDYDQPARHVVGRLDEKLVCYARLLPPGLKTDSASIGRVITKQAIRGRGHGKELMQKSLAYCRDYWPQASITVSAQQYLEEFYQTLGFETVSKPYLEDGIPHLEMLLKQV